MKKVLLLLLSLSLLLPLAACSGTAEEPSDSREAVVYYMLSDGEQDSGQLVAAESRPIADGSDLLHETLTALFSQPLTEGMECPFDEGVRILSYTLTDGVIRLEMSGYYSFMDDMRKTVANCCTVLTLCRLDEVDEVDIYVDSVPILRGLTADDFVVVNTETSPYEKTIRMYFPGADSRYVEYEYHTLTIGRDKQLAEYVMDELLRGPQGEGLVSLIPKGTRVLGVGVENGLCTLNLSREFYDGRPKSAIAERSLLYSIVNSLASISEVDRVQLLVEGQTMDKYLYRAIGKPLERGDFAIGSEADYMADLTLYIPTDGHLLPTAILAERDRNVASEATILQAELALGQRLGFAPAGMELLVVETVTGRCRVTLSGEFFDLEPEDAVLLLKAMTAAVTELPTVLSVAFSVEGEADVAEYGLGTAFDRPEKILLK